MRSTLVEMVLDAPRDRSELLRIAFPSARALIADERYRSEGDEGVFKRWIREVVEPALAKADETVKDGLRACLQPRFAIATTAVTVAVDFVCGILPSYPDGVAQTVAALIVLTANELRVRGRI